MSIFTEAEELINGDRQTDYGPPDINLARIADYWNAYLGDYHFNAKDVAIMLGLMKIARESHKEKRDNMVDAVAYFGMAGELSSEPKSEAATS